jgi:hypothetical protein
MGFADTSWSFMRRSSPAPEHRVRRPGLGGDLLTAWDQRRRSARRLRTSSGFNESRTDYPTSTATSLSGDEVIRFVYEHWGRITSR